jgi:hypothetical protein
MNGGFALFDSRYDPPCSGSRRRLCGISKVRGVLLTLAIANQHVTATTLIVISDDVTNPLRDVIYPLFWRGDFQRSNLCVLLLGLNGLWSLAPFALAAAFIAIGLARRLGTAPADLQGV